MALEQGADLFASALSGKASPDGVPSVTGHRHWEQSSAVMLAGTRTTGGRTPEPNPLSCALVGDGDGVVGDNGATGPLALTSLRSHGFGQRDRGQQEGPVTGGRVCRGAQQQRGCSGGEAVGSRPPDRPDPEGKHQGVANRNSADDCAESSGSAGTAAGSSSEVVHCEPLIVAETTDAVAGIAPDQGIAAASNGEDDRDHVEIAGFCADSEGCVSGRNLN